MLWSSSPGIQIIIVWEELFIRQNKIKIVWTVQWEVISIEKLASVNVLKIANANGPEMFGTIIQIVPVDVKQKFAIIKKFWIKRIVNVNV